MPLNITLVAFLLASIFASSLVPVSMDATIHQEVSYFSFDQQENNEGDGDPFAGIFFHIQEELLNCSVDSFILGYHVQMPERRLASYPEQPQAPPIYI